MKSTVISIIGASLLIGGAVMLSSDSPSSANNVSIVEGKQIVEITAKGKYSPKITTAQAGIPTILRMKTLGTYDCTAALRVPSVGFEQMLPPSGNTDIEVPPQQVGTSVQGRCAMGMYNFEIQFI